MLNFILLAIAIVFNVAAQLLLRYGMKDLVLTTADGILNYMKTLVLNPLLWGSLLCYGLGFILYAAVLSKMEVSKAYPVASAGAILLTVIFSIIFIGESFSYTKIIGAIVCIAGIFLLLR